MTCWEELANAIIEQAADDYCEYTEKKRKGTATKKTLRDLQEVEEFFHSEWFTMLTKVDRDYFLENLREKVND